MPRPPFKFSALTRVGFSDTDAQGVVYYGRYMPYFDLARVEYHRSLDMLRAEPQDARVRDAGEDVEYHAPARFDDLIEVDVRVSRIGTTSVTYEFAAYLEGETLAVTATQTPSSSTSPAASPRRFRTGGASASAPSRAAISITASRDKSAGRSSVPPSGERSRPDRNNPLQRF